VNQTTSQQLEQKKRAKIKANKEVFCVAVDYNQELKYIAMALVDREVHIYRAKTIGNKTQFVCIMSFKVQLPKNQTISSISVNRYVKGQPILIIGTLQGDVRIYEIDIDPKFELLSEKQKLVERKDPKLMENGAFNFFSRNIKIEGNFPFPISRLSSNNLSVLNKKVSIKRSQPITSSFKHQCFPNSQLLEQGPMALVNDEHWNLLIDSDDRQDPEGKLKIMKEITERIGNREHAAIICKAVTAEMKIDEIIKHIEAICQQWLTSFRLSDRHLPETTEIFLKRIKALSKTIQK